MTYFGDARVSTDGQMLDAQVVEPEAAGAVQVFQETVSCVVTGCAQLRRAIKSFGPEDVPLGTRLGQSDIAGLRA